jgi:autotransporter-associated beta strand protein
MPASAVNTYSGGTYVTGGSRLQIVEDSLLGASSGVLTLDAGALEASAGFSSARAIVLGSGNGAIDTNGNQVTLSGHIAGVGALTKTGADKLILSGTSTYTGPTTVNQGTLSVDGSIVSDTTVANGATLGGTGSVGSLTIASGGIYAPGNGIGTQTVNGDLTLAPDAVYAVEANAAGQSDKVVVKGTVDLTGSVLRVLAACDNYKPRTNYVIIDNDGTDAVTGKFFSSVKSNLAFFIPGVTYSGGTGNDVVLTLDRNSRLFTDVARTRNQRAVAGALDQFPTDDPLFLSVLNQTAGGARQAFDALSGEIHATVAGTLADDSRYVRDAILGRLVQATYTNSAGKLASLAAAGPQVASLDSQAMALGYGDKSLSPPPRRPQLAFWTQAFGAWGDFDGNGNAATADRNLGGFVSGMDAAIGGTWRAGLATGASFSNVDANARYSSAQVKSYHLGGYLGGTAGAFALRGGGMWAWSDIDTSRAVGFPGFFERQKSSYNGDTGQIFGEFAYPTAMSISGAANRLSSSP